jgi:hypothetical protein
VRHEALDCREGWEALPFGPSQRPD